MATPNIVPRADSEGGLGTASKYWAAAYIDLIYVGAGKIGRDADNLIDFSVDNAIFFRVNGSKRVMLNGSRLAPDTTDALQLGGTSNMWSDLFLASGATINFDNGNVTLTHSSGALRLADGQKFNFGSGNDLQIKHSGTDGFITNVLGDLKISTSSDDGDIIFLSDDGSGGTTPYLTLDGGNVRTDAAKPIRFLDSIAAQFGTGLDMQVYHSGGAGYIEHYTGNFNIIQHTNDGDIIFSCDDGSGGTTAYLTLDGSTTSMQAAKNIVFADSIRSVFGGGADLSIYHDGTINVIEASSGDLYLVQHNNDKDILFQSDNGAGSIATYFYLDGSSAEHNGSATTALYTNWPDNSRISLGTSHDLQLDHNSTDSLIRNLTGDLYIMNKADDKDIIFQSDDGSGGVTTYFYLDGSSTQVKYDVNLKLHDNKKLIAGDGDDFQIYHDGSNSYISQGGTGGLIISNQQDDSNIIFKSDDGSGGTTAYLTLDGSAGTIIAAKPFSFVDHATAADQVRLQLGTGGDLQLQHDGTNSYLSNNTGDLYIQNFTDDRDIIFQSDDGAGGTMEYFKLDGSIATHDGSANTTRFTKWPDNSIISLGTGNDIRIYHNGTNSYLDNLDGDYYIRQKANDKDLIFTCDDGSGGNTEYFRLDGSLASGGTVYTAFPDNSVATFGSGYDLKIYHDGSNSYISDTGTGDLIIQGANLKLKDGSGNNFLFGTNNSGVTLGHAGGTKLSTTATGVDVTGSLTPSLGVTKPIASAAANVAAAVAGSIYTFSDADGAIVTLPDSGGGGLVGQTFEFVCTATATSNSHKVIFSDTTNEKFIGRLTAIDTDTDNTQLVYVPVTANKAIVMNGTTTGITGSRFTITNVAADVWMIEGYVHHTGNTANPFANS